MMKIGSIALDNMTVLAPLAGATHLPFRLLARQAGCALVCSEMISANGLVRKSEKTKQLLDSRPEEKPLSVQIFGTDPSVMADAASIVESSGADILDINLGCPVKKVIKTGAGVALMKTPEKVEAILKSVRQAINIPLTVKMRTGWDKSGDQARKIADIAQACGVNAVTLHPRTAGQGFGGEASWTLIAEIKNRISIPVIGNGDIVKPEDALKMQHQTGCDAVMIGRAAMGNPWIFSRVLALIRGDNAAVPDMSQRTEVIIKYVKDMVAYFGERRGCQILRSHLGWFVKGLPYSSKFRDSIKHISSQDEAVKRVRDYSDFLQNLSYKSEFPFTLK
ncbi:tRNA dihydrouridine synthase DusB [Thermodesulfobacteriota bacterium]